MAKKKKGFPPAKLDSKLAKFVGKKEMPYFEAVNQVKDYVIKNKLYNPKFKPDEKLKPILGNRPVDFTKISSKVSEHIVRKKKK